MVPAPAAQSFLPLSATPKHFSLSASCADADIDATATWGQTGPSRGGTDVVVAVDANMAEALRAVSVARGVDPEGLALVAFGGAGPLHATDVARELGMTTIKVTSEQQLLDDLSRAVGIAF